MMTTLATGIGYRTRACVDCRCTDCCLFDDDDGDDDVDLRDVARLMNP